MTDPTTVHDARKAVLQRLAEAHDRFSEQEQALVFQGMYAEAEGAHVIASWCLRAFRAELDDPEPAS